MANIIKLFMTVIVVASAVQAKPVKYTEKFDDVKVIYPAVSTKTECTIKVDINEGLVNNLTSCDVIEISIYNKDSMWLGNIDGISAYGDARYQDYDTERYKGKGKYIRATYSFESEDASESNAWRVSCPKGMIMYIDHDDEWGDYYTCKTPYHCGRTGYATDSIHCERLPDNAHRNKTSGFSCNKGYVWNYGYCEEKAKCEKTERYDSENNICVALPDNAQWIEDTPQYECNIGYVLQNYNCVMKEICVDDTRYVETTNSCLDLPNNAEWSDSNSADWNCKDNYVFHNGECEEKAICGYDLRYDENNNTCVAPYSHSSWTGNGKEYVCDDGYVDMGGGICDEKPECFGHYNAINNSCYEKPTNSHWIDNYSGLFQCDNGFVQIDGQCEDYSQYTYDVKPSYTYEVMPSYRYNTRSTSSRRDFIDNFHFRHDIGMDVGVGSAKDNLDNPQPILTIGADYNAGFMFGSDNVSVRGQGAIGLVSTFIDYYKPDVYSSGVPESIMALLLLYGVNIGIDLWKVSIDYSYLFVLQGELDNIKFSDAVHKIRLGANLNEHWNIHLAILPHLVNEAKVLKEYDATIYHIGFTYRF